MGGPFDWVFRSPEADTNRKQVEDTVSSWADVAYSLIERLLNDNYYSKDEIAQGVRITSAPQVQELHTLSAVLQE